MRAQAQAPILRARVPLLSLTSPDDLIAARIKLWRAPHQGLQPLGFLSRHPAHSRMPALLTADPAASYADVLVIGAGPSGLMAAHGLARNGVNVRVVDKRPVSVASGQADGVMPRTLEVLEVGWVLLYS